MSRGSFVRPRKRRQQSRPSMTCTGMKRRASSLLVALPTGETAKSQPHISFVDGVCAVPTPGAIIHVPKRQAEQISMPQLVSRVEVLHSCYSLSLTSHNVKPPCAIS